MANEASAKFMMVVPQGEEVGKPGQVSIWGRLDPDEEAELKKEFFRNQPSAKEFAQFRQGIGERLGILGKGEKAEALDKFDADLAYRLEGPNLLVDVIVEQSSSALPSITVVNYTYDRSAEEAKDFLFRREMVWHAWEEQAKEPPYDDYLPNSSRSRFSDRWRHDRMKGEYFEVFLMERVAYRGGKYRDFMWHYLYGHRLPEPAEWKKDKREGFALYHDSVPVSADVATNKRFQEILGQMGQTSITRMKDKNGFPKGFSDIKQIAKFSNKQDTLERKDFGLSAMALFSSGKK